MRAQRAQEVRPRAQESIFRQHRHRGRAVPVHARRLFPTVSSEWRRQAYAWPVGLFRVSAPLNAAAPVHNGN